MFQAPEDIVLSYEEAKKIRAGRRFHSIFPSPFWPSY